MKCLCFDKYKMTHNFYSVSWTYFIGGTMTGNMLGKFEKCFGEFAIRTFISYLIVVVIVRIVANACIKYLYVCKCRDGGLDE
jgi:hypothetical protein